jgi:hypothetical protein
VHNNLGIAYAHGTHSDQAENLEQAVVHCQQALEVYTCQAYPDDWARIQNYLTVAVRHTRNHVFTTIEEGLMAKIENEQLIADIARDLVSQIAPQELPLFRASSEAYFKDPEKALQSQSAKDDMLGFGAGDAVVLLTPIVLATLNEVVKFVVEEAKKSVQGEGAAWIQQSIKAVFKKFHQSEAGDKKKPAALTVEQLAQVRKIAFNKARQLKLSEDRAKILADAVVGSLATAPS